MLYIIEPEVLARAWYVFQRNRISMPATWGAGVQPKIATWRTPEMEREPLVALVEAALPSLRPDPAPIAGADAAARIAAAGELLLYGPGERLAPPAWAAGRRLLLLRGEAI